jgi:acyl-CoA reductase-like NAD-dependent aldehyde dehydrogenase
VRAEQWVGGMPSERRNARLRALKDQFTSAADDFADAIARDDSEQLRRAKGALLVSIAEAELLVSPGAPPQED